MFYRVVMQGRTVGGADLNEVKRNFMRVTGLPVSVTEDLFAGGPKVVKRQVPQSDAERIAATLRAIGAAATVEREVGAAEEKTPEGIRIVATPLSSGPPTVIPGMEPANEPAAAPRAVTILRKIVDRWPAIAGVGLVVAAGVFLAPIASDLVSSFRRAPASEPVTKAPAAPVPEAQAHALPDAALMLGPWRCTDQRSGLASYWSFNDDGSMIFHGDALRDRPAAYAPLGWKIEGRKLVFTSEGAPVIYTIANLTLTRLRYADERSEIECRRP